MSTGDPRTISELMTPEEFKKLMEMTPVGSLLVDPTHGSITMVNGSKIIYGGSGGPGPFCSSGGPGGYGLPSHGDIGPSGAVGPTGTVMPAGTHVTITSTPHSPGPSHRWVTGDDGYLIPDQQVVYDARTPAPIQSSTKLMTDKPLTETEETGTW